MYPSSHTTIYQVFWMVFSYMFYKNMCFLTLITCSANRTDQPSASLMLTGMAFSMFLVLHDTTVTGSALPTISHLPQNTTSTKTYFCYHVDDAIARVTKATVTTGTREWLGSCVDAHVGVEIRSSCETLATNIAYKWSLSCVSMHVKLQLVLALIGFITQVTVVISRTSSGGPR